MIRHPVVACGSEEAASRSREVLRAALDGACHVTASIVRGPVAMLGARQRAASVLVDTPWVRRATTGAEAWIAETGIVWSLALPHVAALFRDARGETLLNRNVRGFLRGLTRCGALSHYLGRDVISLQRRAVAVLGYDVLDDGRVLVDVIAGWEHAPTLPDARQGERRREAPRAEGVALRGCVGGRGPEEVADAVIQAVASTSGVALVEGDTLGRAASPDPSTAEASVRSARRVPIGWVEAGELEGAAWLGGDLLASTAWLRRAERALATGEPLPDGAVMHGATPEDLEVVWRAIP
ncbi:MAG: hypothetical protein R3A48_15720 [Polyangiales bacterium]